MHISRRPIVLGCVTFGMGAFAPMVVTSRAEAQEQRLISASMSQTARAASEVPVAERRIVYVGRRVAVEQVLRAIGQQAGLQLAVDRSTVPLDGLISLDVQDVPLARVLSLVAERSGLAVRLSPDGVTIMVTRGTGTAASAQEMGTISGHVMSAKTKRPVAGATVLIDDATKGVVTDDDGTFRVAATVGDHRVTVRSVGFMRQMKRVIVTDTKTVTADFTLEESASVLDEVVVTGTVVATERKAIPTPITVITAKDIEDRGVTRVDQLLRGEVPGVIALERGTQSYSDQIGKMATARVYTRGSASLDGSANPIKTYVDGVELLDPSYLGTIDPKTIEKIEIITGPQAATIYGSGAMGGVMQIFTKKGNGRGTPDMTLRLSYGMLESNLSPSKTPSHSHSFNLTGGTGPDFTYAASGSYNYTGQWQPGLWNRGYGASLGATHVRGRFTGSGTFSINEGRNGSTGAGGTCYGAFGEAAGGSCYYSLWEKVFYEMGEMLPSWYLMNFTSGRESMSSSQTASLNVDYRASSIWQHHLTLGRNQTNFGVLPSAARYVGASDSLMSVNGSNGQRTTVSYNMTFLPHFGPTTSTLTLGVNGSNGLETQYAGCKLTKSSTSLVGCYGGGAGVGTSIDNSSWGGFGSWQLGLFSHVYLTLGLRGERNPSYGSKHKIDWTPTNGMTYTFDYRDVSVKFLGSYGRATRPPQSAWREAITETSAFITPSQYTTQFEAPDLTPEYSRGPQGGVEVYYGNLFSFTVNHYTQKVTDLIQRAKVDSMEYVILSTGATGYQAQYQYQNTATIRQSGWEGTGATNIGPVTLKGTYSWNNSRVLSVNPKASTAYRPGESFRYVPTHSGNLTASYALGGTSLTVVTNYIGSSTQLGGREPEWIVRSGARIRAYVDRRGAAPDLADAPGYAKTDVSMSQRLTPWASATLNITNAANSYMSDVGGLFPALGRQTLLGMSIRYPTR